jgi:hypothetical protein
MCPEVTVTDEELPEDLERRPAMYLVDGNGQRSDADLFEAILAEGDAESATAVGREVAERLGTPKHLLDKLFGPQDAVSTTPA